MLLELDRQGIETAAQFAGLIRSVESLDAFLSGSTPGWANTVVIVRGGTAGSALTLVFEGLLHLGGDLCEEAAVFVAGAFGGGGGYGATCLLHGRGCSLLGRSYD